MKEYDPEAEERKHKLGEKLLENMVEQSERELKRARQQEQECAELPMSPGSYLVDPDPPTVEERKAWLEAVVTYWHLVQERLADAPESVKVDVLRGICPSLQAFVLQARQKADAQSVEPKPGS